MSEKISLEPREIGKFLGYVAAALCYNADANRIKTKDMAPQVEAAIALGLLLAKRQPELVDACVQYWSFTREGTPEDYVDGMLTMYQGLVEREE